jgi:hypothetical protein
MVNENWLVEWESWYWYKSQNLHTKKKHIQILTFGQQKNVRYKKQ